MRKFTLLFTALLGLAAAKAQTVATFDTLTLPGADTFYVNMNNPGTDVGFDDGLAHFECYYQSSQFGTYWDHGFSYSNMVDSLTGDYTNDHASIAGYGYNNSAQYLVSWGPSTKVFLKGKAQGQPVNGFYISNATYPYFIMKDGDPFGFAKKMGGPSGNDSDWYSIIVRGYNNGQLTADSVETFLADFRDPSNATDTVYRGWRWVNLLPLGEVDSLVFSVSSSDVGQFGINTPAYFCIDNFGTYETSSVKSIAQAAAKVYPNPATDKLYVELLNNKKTELLVYDMSGKVVMQATATDKVTLLSTSALTPGNYMLQLVSEEGRAAVRFVKQ
ncbi:MAG: DUF4465 domain-containing protein [Sphingobacteriales bacterium]|nr:MAG: DUF4465 domain-containing protein [Sphingobacteriales bacterium]